MPPVEVARPDSEETTAPATKPVIGIIYPPPEVRNIVDKTASFVARNGQEFEARIRHNEINNPKFNFLAPTDPYHAYYKHKVKEFQEGRGQEPTAAKTGFGYMLQKPQPVEQVKVVEASVPREPPPEFEFIADPPSISAFDLDMVKTTAQFVARNGRQFLTNLMKMEARNYQFDFLRPQHSLFNYFTKLVEQYTKILIPPKDLLGKLRNEAENHNVVFDLAKYRMEWVKHQAKERKREEEEKEKERVAYAQIDWHDFVVVETVDYQPSETGNLPPPTTPDEVGARLLQQQRFEDGVPTTNDDVEPDEEGSLGVDEDIGADHEQVDDDEFDEEDEVVTRSATKPSVSQHALSSVGPSAIGADTRVQDMEEDSESGSDAEDNDLKNHQRPDSNFTSNPPQPPPIPKEVGPKLPPLPPNPEQVIIRKDYNPKAPKMSDALAADKFLISPITGEPIPADKIQEHMRIGLLDPKWIEQRDRALAERREQEEVYAPGSAIGDQLKHLAERRTDIFGSGAEETQIGKKIGEEEKKEKASKVIWDGHSASMEKVSQKARENITIEDQIAVIHKVKGLVADDDKEKIGPAMPKQLPSAPSTTPASVPPQPAPLPATVPTLPPPPPVTASVPAGLPNVAPPPAASASSSVRPSPPLPPSIPVVAPPAPPSVRPVVTQVSAQLPPRPLPPGAGMIPVPMPVQHGMMITPPHQPGVIAPGPPMVVPPMVRPSFMPGMPLAPMMPPVPPPIRPPVQPPAAPTTRPSEPSEDEPLSKRAKTEDQLIPENEFLAANKGPVTFRVQVPNSMEKSEWKLNGQAFTITLPLTDTVSVIKAKMFDEIAMPAGKQKLQLDGMFMKDSNTLAFYNFTSGCVVQLQVKERGGRKK